MSTKSKTICAATLGLVLLFAASMPANAQFRGRLGDRGMSNGKKAAVIGGSAAAGALIGGLLGGKKGAVIGGLLGAGGGTGYVYYKGRDDDRYRRYYGSRDYRDYRNYSDYRFRTRRFDNTLRGDRGYHAWDRWNRR
jgi:hypothetical protein